MPLSVSFRIDASKLTRSLQAWTLFFGDRLSNNRTGRDLPRFAGHTFAKAAKYRLILNLIVGGQEYVSVAPITVS